MQKVFWLYARFAEHGLRIYWITQLKTHMNHECIFGAVKDIDLILAFEQRSKY